LKIRIIGAVAAGTSAAAKARRNSESADIRLYCTETDISYSACGLPYWLGGEVAELEELVPRDVAYFKSKYNVDVRTSHEVVRIDPTGKVLEVRNMATGEVFVDSFDKLLIATGASAVRPPIPGADCRNVFTVRNPAGMREMDRFLRERMPKRVLVVGSGPIGLEMAENFVRRGLQVTVVEMEDHLVKPLDADVSVWVQEILKNNGVRVILSDAVLSMETGAGKAHIQADSADLPEPTHADMADEAGDKPEGMRKPGSQYVTGVNLHSGGFVDTDMVLLSVGIRPNVAIARDAGVRLGPTGAIAVNGRMETNLPDIHAAGDCAESLHLVTGKAFWHPIGSTANKMGRIAGDQMTGGGLTFQGTLGTSIFRIFDGTVAQTGLSEREARALGYKVSVCHNIKPDKPEYFHGEEMLIKAVADRSTGKLLGAQIVGKAGVDKRIDVLATALSFGARAEDLMHLDLAYAPPFSTTKDPVLYTGMILANDLSGTRPLITAEDLLSRKEAGETIRIVDARVPAQYRKAHVPGAENCPQDMLRETEWPNDANLNVVTYCNKGVTGNAAQNILKNLGCKNVYNLSGGMRQFNKISDRISARQTQE